MDEKPQLQGRPSWATCLVLILGGVLTLLGWQWASRQMEERGRVQFEKQWSAVAGALRERVQIYQEVLRATRGLFAASTTVERAEWTAFVKSLDLNRVYPGLHSLGFAPFVRIEDLPAHVQMMRSDGFPGYTVTPSVDRFMVFPIAFIEPGTDQTQKWLGYDLQSQEGIWETMVKVAQGDDAAVTPRMKWVAEGRSVGDAGGSSFLMVLATYHPGQTLETAEDRKRALRGFLYCSFQISEFMRGLMPHRAPGIDVELYEGESVVASSLLFDDDGRADGLLSPDAPDAGSYRHRELISMNGQSWTLHVNSRPEFDRQVHHHESWLILMSGGVITLLLAGLVHMQSRGRDWAMALAGRMTIRLRELSAHVLDLQDQERARIARELHDSTAQHLGLASSRLGGLKESIALDEGHRKELEDAMELVGQATQEVRTLSYLLHPPTLDLLGLAGALSDFARGFESRSRIRVRCDVPADFRRPPPEVELALFRVAQEALTNVLKHSTSEDATLRLEQWPDKILLTVTDRGMGIDSEKLKAMNEYSAHLGVGIAGMRDRLEQLGGWLELQSGSHGTRVRAIVPFLIQEKELPAIAKQGVEGAAVIQSKAEDF